MEPRRSSVSPLYAHLCDYYFCFFFWVLIHKKKTTEILEIVLVEWCNKNSIPRKFNRWLTCACSVWIQYAFIARRCATVLYMMLMMIKKINYTSCRCINCCTKNKGESFHYPQPVHTLYHLLQNLSPKYVWYWWLTIGSCSAIKKKMHAIIYYRSH